MQQLCNCEVSLPCDIGPFRSPGYFRLNSGQSAVRLICGFPDLWGSRSSRLWISIHFRFLKETTNKKTLWVLFYSVVQILLTTYSIPYFRHSQGHGKNVTVPRHQPLPESFKLCLLSSIIIIVKIYTFFHKYWYNHLYWILKPSFRWTHDIWSTTFKYRFLIIH